ncbi:MAG: hypothetical protein SVU88_04505 [Candidatus Nanohaloarchaea archaeon]|nr:hypothetical protein [Candidatus Nanohaloarchaea archaeon]
MSMCKVCGRFVGRDERETVVMGGSERTLCQQCAVKPIPIRSPAPGQLRGGSHV